jgi:hypothetical protein
MDASDVATAALEGVSSEFLQVLQHGTPSFEVDAVAEKITIYVAPHDNQTDQNIKKNVEFVVNTAREAIALLIVLGKQSGNPRFFEAVTSLNHSILNANSQLMDLMRLQDERVNGRPPEGGGTNILVEEGATVVMTTADAIKARRNGGSQMRTVGGGS